MEIVVIILLVLGIVLVLKGKPLWSFVKHLWSKESGSEEYDWQFWLAILFAVVVYVYLILTLGTWRFLD